jgi:hypothetical protein
MSDVEEGDFLAAGAFGSVSLGRYKDEAIVVKRMLTLEQISQPEMYSSFLKECWAMSFLNHDCIIHMVGISLEPLCMVIEFMNLRDLRHFLDHFCLPPWSLRLKILMDVSRGMSYAHEQFPSIVHRDLKSPNVFLSLNSDGLLRAKVADLGLATVLPKLVKNAVVENPTWSAPEVCLREPYSQPADVYSFGIVMWEVMTGQFPFSELWSRTQFTTEIVAEITQGTRPTLPENVAGIPPGFIDLVQSAWAQREEDRPSFNQLCQGLAVISRNCVESVENKSEANLTTMTVKTMFRLPRIWGGVAALVGGSMLFTIRADNEFDVTDLRTDSISIYRHVSQNFSLRGAQLVAVSPTTLWAVDDERNEILVLESSGRSSTVVCSEVQRLSSLVLVGENVWTTGLEVPPEGQEARTCLFVWPIDRMTRRLMAKVKGELRYGISASNFSVYFACSREKGNKNFLWRMRVNDKKSFKLRLPSAAVCLIDVESRAEIWCVCPGANCIVRSTYDLREVGRFAAGPNVFRSGIYLSRQRCVASIGAASFCLWDCVTLVPFSIRSFSNTLGMTTARPMARDVPPALVNASAFGEIVAVTAEQTLLLMIESAVPVPFVPEPRKIEEERKASRVEKREKATRTMLQQFEKSDSSDDKRRAVTMDARYGFAPSRYTGESRPMGLGDVLKLSSMEDLFSDDVLSKVQAEREARGKMSRSRDRSGSDTTSDDQLVGRGSGNVPPVRIRSNSSATSEVPLLNVISPRRRSNSFRDSTGAGRGSPNKSPAKTPGISPRVVTSPLERSPNPQRANVLRSVSVTMIEKSPSPQSATSSSGGVGGVGAGTSSGGVASGGSSVGTQSVAEILRQKRLSLLRRNESVVVERSVLHGDSNSKLFAYEKRSVEMSPLEVQMSTGLTPTSPLLDRSSSEKRAALDLDSSDSDSVSPTVLRHKADSDDSRHFDREDSGVSMVGGLSSSLDLRNITPSSVGKKQSAGPIGLVGLIDDSTLEKLYPNDSKVARRNTAVQRKLQRAEPVQRRMQSSVNIGGVSMAVNKTPPKVPKLNITGQPSKSRSKFPWKKHSGGEDSTPPSITSPSSSFEPSSSAPNLLSSSSSASQANVSGRVSPHSPHSPHSPGGGSSSFLSPNYGGTRSRSSTMTGVAAKKGHHRTRSMTQKVEDAEVKEIRDLLNVRLGNGVQVMKGRSGSVSGPQTVRGVPTSQKHMRRVLQGEAGLSPPSSDEHRDSEEVIHRYRAHSPKRSPVSSPARAPMLEEAMNSRSATIDAHQLDSMYSKSGKPTEATSPTRNEVDPPKRASRVPRALTKLSELFRGTSSGGGSSSGSPSSPSSAVSSPSNFNSNNNNNSNNSNNSISSNPLDPIVKTASFTELNTRIERRGSFAGPILSEALLRVSKAAGNKSESEREQTITAERRKSLGEEFEERADH